MNYILGAINKNTQEYESIDIVEKTNSYICISCNTDLILRKGEKNYPSFIHKKSNNCCYFKHPSDEQLINDAKMYLNVLLKKNKVSVFRKCDMCKFKIKIEIPKYIDSELILNKIKFNVYKDICIYDDNDHESYNINMMELIYRRVIDFSTKNIELLCNKTLRCEDCKNYKVASY